MNSYEEWARLLEIYGKALGEAGLRDLHCHLSGIEYSAKGEKNHLAVEESDLDLDALLRALHDFGCEGRLLCESPRMEDDAHLIQAAWMRISGEEAE